MEDETSGLGGCDDFHAQWKALTGSAWPSEGDLYAEAKQAEATPEAEPAAMKELLQIDLWKGLSEVNPHPHPHPQSRSYLQLTPG